MVHTHVMYHTSTGSAWEPGSGVRASQFGGTDVAQLDLSVGHVDDDTRIYASAIPTKDTAGLSVSRIIDSV